jgi:hypothetical protein
MLIYHGTRFENVHRILSQGLLPRGSQRGSESGNWSNPSSQIYQSKDNAVYLSTAFAPYYSYTSNFSNMLNLLNGDFIKYESVNGALIEIDWDLLDQNNFYPDEDFLVDSPQFRKDINAIDERQQYFRENLESYQHLYQDSLQQIGNCCYIGVIPPSAISRITTWSWDKVEILHSWSYRFVYKNGGVRIPVYEAMSPLLHLLTKCFAKREEDLREEDLRQLALLHQQMLSQKTESFVDDNNIAVSIQQEIEQIKIEYDKDILRNT